ncbi:hypothetical protein [Nonomuraea sp. NPDC046570]
MITLAVELDQLGLEVGADGPHDFFASREDFVGERSAPVFWV